jgi:hypothetical protein
MKKSMLMVMCGAMVAGLAGEVLASGGPFARWRCRPRATYQYQTQAPQEGGYRSFSYEPGGSTPVISRPATSQPQRPPYLDAGHKAKGKFGAW